MQSKHIKFSSHQRASGICEDADDVYELFFEGVDVCEGALFGPGEVFGVGGDVLECEHVFFDLGS